MYIPSDKSSEEAKDRLVTNPIGTDFSENFDASLDYARKNLLSISQNWYDASNLKETYSTQYDKAKSLGVELPSYADINREVGNKADPFSPYNGGHEKAFNEGIDRLKQLDPSTDWKTYETLLGSAKQKTIADAKQARIEFEDVSSRAIGGGALGSMAGTALGVMHDPINIGLTLATAPIAFEGLAATVAGNALIGGAGEVGAQFVPGGVRDFAREQGLSEAQINEETKHGLLGATAGGGAFAGAIHGAGKGLSYVWGKIKGTNAIHANQAVNQALADPHLDPQARDDLQVIQHAQQLNDISSFGTIVTNLTDADLQVIHQNALAYENLSKAIVGHTYDPNITFKIDDADLSVLHNRIGDMDVILNEITSGNIHTNDIREVVSSLVSGNRVERFDELVAEHNFHNSQEHTISTTEHVQNNANDVARELEPSLFEKYDDLVTKRDTYKKWIDDLDNHRLDTEKGPFANEIAKLESQINDLKEQGGFHGKRNKLEARLEELTNANNEALANVFSKDSPDMAMVRKSLQETDYGIRDLTPQVNDAMGRANEYVASNPTREVTTETTAPKSDKVAEIEAAKKVIEEAKLVEQNKIEWARLYHSNQTISPSELRSLVGFNELRNRMNAGENISHEDFVDMLSPDQATKFNDLVDKNGLEVGAEKFYAKEVSRLSKDSEARLDHIAGKVDEILNDIVDSPSLSDFASRLKAQSDRLKINPVDEMKVIDKLIKDVTTEDRLEGAIYNNQDNDMVLFIGEDGKQMTAKEVLAEIDEFEKMADLVDACKFG